MGLFIWPIWAYLENNGPYMGHIYKIRYGLAGKRHKVGTALRPKRPTMCIVMCVISARPFGPKRQKLLGLAGKRPFGHCFEAPLELMALWAIKKDQLRPNGALMQEKYVANRPHNWIVIASIFNAAIIVVLLWPNGH